MYHHSHHFHYAGPPYEFHHLKRETLRAIAPYVRYGLNEAKFTSLAHALREVAAMSYLYGKGYDPHVAHQMVESWEIDEKFYPGESHE
nr:hypothetical protein [Aneurinibacillus terranovensis]